jgi:hypothetical protein
MKLFPRLSMPFSNLLMILCILSAGITWTRLARGQHVERVNDMYPGEMSLIPSTLAVLKGKLYFAANHEELGRELWVSDGTTTKY